MRARPFVTVPQLPLRQQLLETLEVLALLCGWEDES